MSAVEVARFGEHPHNIPDPLPCGNYVASQLRCAYDDSSNLFPASAGSQRSYNKYTSVTMQDFFIKDFNETVPDYDDASTNLPFQRKRETVADVLSKPHAHQMFHSWNVPPRYVASDDDTFITGMVPEEPTMVTPPAPERISRQMSQDSNDVKLPNINLRNKKASAKGMTREYTKIQDKGPLQMTAVPTVLKPQRSRTDLMMKPSIPNQTTKPEPFVRSVTDLKPSVVKKTETNNNMEDIRKEFQKSLQPHAVRTAEHYFKLAPQTDRKVIERILRMTEKKHQMDNTLKKTLLPDAKDTVEKWLDNATEEERHVALRFFNSLAGSKLMGISVAEQKKRLQQVIKTLEDGDGKIETSSEYKPRRKMIPKGKGKFNHIRLLTPNTRSNRWMHTTWHHLPEYKEKTVENSSSHYIRPHEPISRHFVIHPDWG